MASALEIGFELDRRYRLVHGDERGACVVDQSKKPELLLLCEVLQGVQYALIGGLALQTHQAEPRTTLDIDVAVVSYDALPSAALLAAGFTLEGRFAHSENWRGPQGTPVQFSDDEAFVAAILRAEVYLLDGHGLRVISRHDLLRAKLRAAADVARRKSKRMQDLADVQSLIEQYPDLESQLTADERSRLVG
jgi:hypothetical protein